MQPETRPLANRKESFMSLHPHTVDPIPEQTARIAHAAFRRGNPFMRMRDEIGTLFTDEAFAPLFPARGRPVVSPWRLALVCVMQYVEGLSDRQAAEAVRARIDWKYSLSLALEDPGFDASVLSEFRTRLVSGGLEQRMLDLLLEHFRAHKLLKARGKQRTDSTHVLAAIRAVNRLECVGGRCVRPSIASLWSPRTGCGHRATRSGLTATDHGSMTPVCPRNPRRGGSWRRSSPPMAID